MVDELMKGGVDIVLGGIDNYLCLVDLCLKGVIGKVIEVVLGCVYIICNKNGVLFDFEKFFVILGICLGVFVGIICGFGEQEFCQIVCWIVEVVDGLVVNGEEGNVEVEVKVKVEVEVLCVKFLFYSGM